MAKKTTEKQPKVKKITATYARNNFFTLVHDAYVNNTQYEIQKNNLLMGYIVSPKDYLLIDQSKEQQKEDRKQKQLDALNKLAELRKKTSMTGDSVKIVRKMREDRINHLMKLSKI